MTYRAFRVRTVHRWRGRRFVVRQVLISWDGTVTVRPDGVVFFSAISDPANWELNDAERLPTTGVDTASNPRV